MRGASKLVIGVVWLILILIASKWVLRRTGLANIADMY